ncbi:hypothetical protein N7493_008923 [Penicillium malachiteum]|uniref:Uncharacterized protein n=1 Tax=Penicillium malachiteum TaxID=1324776 RepID=A0AAD6HFI2_9EURO|nr:hypothetical protein N7493_008923 [Penicillium malachiteum]
MATHDLPRMGGLYPLPQPVYDRVEVSGSENPAENTAETAAKTTADEESIQSSVLQIPHSVPLLILNDGDTLLYIDPAPSRDPCLASKSKSAVPLRVRSSTLLRTGSQYLAKFFEQSYQNRIRRKRGFVDELPPGIEFLVDLTPAIVEEDAVIALTEISCPKGIRIWATYQGLWQLPATCVGGLDEFELAKRPQTLFFEEMPENPMYNGGNETFGQRGPDSNMMQSLARHGMPVEYSASRHRDGIEWVLHVLEGLSIVLDTPCKMWTFFAVANILEVATQPAISDYILSWFYEGNNCRFIEVHPEISFRVACGIQSDVLCRHAFAGMVADEATVHLIRSAGLQPYEQWAPLFQKSRMHGLLSDTDIQRIEYASKAFTEDILKHFLHLAGTDMGWLDEIPEFQKILLHASQFPEDREIAHDLIKLIKQNTRSRLCHSLFRSKDPERMTDEICPETSPFWHAFKPEDMIMRAMGRGFWTDLAYQNFDLPAYPDANPHPTYLSLMDIGHGLLPFDLEADVPIGPVAGELLAQKVTAFNIRAQEVKLAYESKQSSPSTQSNYSLPMRPRVNEPSNTPHSATDASVPIASESPGPLAPEMVLPLRLANPANTDHPQQSQFPNPTTDVSRDPATDNANQSCEPVFNLHKFMQFAGTYISSYACALLYSREQVPLDRRATDHLTCLTDGQWKYLPLWAGGNDDGTGGVFNDQDIPNLSSEGFLGPGPAIGTRSGSANSQAESFNQVGPSEYNSTVCQASRHATYSHCSDVQSMDEREWISGGARFYKNGYDHRPGQGYKQILLPEPDYEDVVDYDYCPLTITYDGTDESGDLRPVARSTAQGYWNGVDTLGHDGNMEVCADEFEVL